MGKNDRKCQPLPFVTTFDSVRKEREGITGKERRLLKTLVVERVGDGSHHPQFLDVGGCSGYASSENRLNDFVHNLVEVLRLDGSQSAIDVAFNVACDYLAFHYAWLGQLVGNEHIVVQGVGILWVDGVV